ncbi:hypothetical protein [Burkholderia arboris]|uniref:hypothetical protein n=1 Tax=Burkholderia arboris TaxID=488730 RepID=UPI00210C1892|nr:hypothetical protein [Burkholderia arboris]UTV60006.1 hypothetical protein NLX30_38130 [Burkholderia arboris]
MADKRPLVGPLHTEERLRCQDDADRGITHRRCIHFRCVRIVIAARAIEIWMMVSGLRSTMVPV